MERSKSLDKRTVNRYIAKGKLTAKEYEDYLKRLPDDEVNGEWVKLDMVDAEITDDESHDSDDSDEDETY